MSDRPSHLLDPVCSMTVDVARAEVAGLLLEYEGRTFAFCGKGCRRAFVEDPESYVARSGSGDGGATPMDHTADGHDALPVIDEGMRRWYESCSCCLSEAYPEIKAQLDAERAAAAVAAVDPGICEVAEAKPTWGVGEVTPA